MSRATKDLLIGAFCAPYLFLKGYPRIFVPFLVGYFVCFIFLYSINIIFPLWAFLLGFYILSIFLFFTTIVVEDKMKKRLAKKRRKAKKIEEE